MASLKSIPILVFVAVLSFAALRYYSVFYAPEHHHFPCPPLLQDASVHADPSHTPLRCYFSPSYDVARDRFRHAVERANGLWTSKPIGFEGLTIDFGVFHPPAVGTAPSSDHSAKERKVGDSVLVHFSGTHGVEAYAGRWLSAVSHIRRK